MRILGLFLGLFYKICGTMILVFGGIKSIGLDMTTHRGPMKMKSNKQKESSMAYQLNWNPDGKPSEKDMKAYLNYVAPDLVDTRFMVIAESDDGGRHMVIMAEWDDAGNPPWGEASRNIDGKGWRVIRLTVPHGYLETFYNQDGTKRVTKEHD